MNFVIVDGRGDPNTAQDYSDAVEALYSAAYAIKLLSRRTLGRDYVVPPLEGLWSADDPAVFATRDKDKYQWTMMIMQLAGLQQLDSPGRSNQKTKADLPALSKVRFEPYAEGRSLQLLHIGSYDDEAPKLKQLHDDYMPEHHLTFNGPHHEIYLSDPRRRPGTAQDHPAPARQELMIR